MDIPHPYLRANVLIVPRQIHELITPHIPPKIPPDGSLHWVGWFAIAVDSLPANDRTYAVWQDYRRRGFTVVEPSGEVTRLLIGNADLDTLITSIEKLAKG